MFIKQAWNGQIAVWKAVVLVSLGGLALTLVVSIGVSLALLFLVKSGLMYFNHVAIHTVFFSFILSAFGIFAVRSLWLCAANPKGKISHALVRFWAIILGAYIFAVLMHVNN
ncbi:MULTISPECIES: hypothetical protein [Photobacterium]|uniref:Uncharacterized protein n=1 Tax=Photobacterium halotolerans TaxID=265726 RepID=A0A0F5VEA0_9GAMM|nr:MULTISPECIES: hypothetical protein [Photobacterium]KKD00501.1 hypothetical protein KY46_07715 [Photobacterium halotolerans]UIP30645.1 hypothetical protein LN341_18245 [Photobacterium sp. TLY01]